MTEEGNMSEHEHVYNKFVRDYKGRVCLACRCKECLRGDSGEWIDEAEIIRRVNAYDRLKEQRDELMGVLSSLDIDNPDVAEMVDDYLCDEAFRD